MRSAWIPVLLLLPIVAAGAVPVTERGDYVEVDARGPDPGVLVLATGDGTLLAAAAVPGTALCCTSRIALPPGMAAAGRWRVTFATTEPDPAVNVLSPVCVPTPGPSICIPYFPDVWVSLDLGGHTLRWRIAGWTGVATGSCATAQDAAEAWAMDLDARTVQSGCHL
jgi:hypothetical protein